MEENWVQRVRHIAKLQAHGIVDALINPDHHLILKKRNGQEVDAGEIKTRRPGAVVTIAYQTNPDEETDVYVTKDGGLWLPASSQGRWQGGTPSAPNSGCWTGDRFMVPIYNYEAGFPIDGVEPGYSQMLQSFDGGTWAFHPDVITFGAACRGSINGMDASGDGVVVAIGDNMGPGEDSSMAISRDFGATWEVISTDEARYPFLDLSLYFQPINGVCCKNRFEWVVGNGYTYWYTHDGGGRWAPVVFPDAFFSPSSTYGFALRYFNGFWWMFGSGGGDPTDTPLLKSPNLVDWESVVTPWSGPSLYPPNVDGSSGYIENMEYDPFTNTVLCNGATPTSMSTPLLMSTDGGLHFFEIGFRVDKATAEAGGFDGIYEMPSWDIGIGGGMAAGFGWWFMANTSTPNDLWPSIFRISTDGRIVEPVIPDRQYNTYAYVLLAGGYLGMEKAKV
jgi:hypothetical protein